MNHIYQLKKRFQPNVMGIKKCGSSHNLYCLVKNNVNVLNIQMLNVHGCIILFIAWKPCCKWSMCYQCYKMLQTLLIFTNRHNYCMGKIFYVHNRLFRTGLCWFMLVYVYVSLLPQKKKKITTNFVCSLILFLIFDLKLKRLRIQL